MTDLNGKCVVITGASRGIGEACARVFHQAGANVVLLSRGREAIAAIAYDLGSRALAIACDVVDYGAVEKATQSAIDAFGGIDIWINNAGAIEPIAHLADSDPAGWAENVDVNLKGTYHGIRAALPGMLANQRGTIINISSGAANNPIEGWSHYCASKAGAAMLTRMIHEEYGDKGIRGLGLSPGTVATQMQVEIKASGVNAVSRLDWSEHIPPDWPAKTCLWMCGGQADEYLGRDVSLRDDEIRRAVGLIA